MRWRDAGRARLRLLFAGRAAESRINEEFRLHIELETEALRGQGANDAGAAALVEVADGVTAQPAVERPLEKLVFVNVLKDLADRLVGDVVADAGLPDLLDHAGAATMADAALHSRQSPGHAAVVERAVRRQAADRGVDVIGIELAAGEPRAKLRFGQLARG